MLGGPKSVHLDWRGPVDLEVRGDARWLRQMLDNLLHNAIRHTPSGGRVQVDVAVAANAVEVAVTDGGGGIPEADRERIFERFVRLDAARTGDGAGLGLPIARAIAEAHGGTLVLARSDGLRQHFRRATAPARIVLAAARRPLLSVHGAFIRGPPDSRRTGAAKATAPEKKGASMRAPTRVLIAAVAPWWRANPRDRPPGRPRRSPGQTAPPCPRT